MAMNAEVTITYDPTGKLQLTINPQSAGIVGSGTATWTISAPNGCVTAIVFDSGNCPFPASGEAPVGVYGSTGAPISTQPARHDTNGNWPYKVTVRGSNDDVAAPAEADGAVVIKDNP